MLFSNPSDFVIAAIVALGTILSPLILTIITGRQRRAEKQEDYKRQDEVARLNEARQDAIAKRAMEVAKVAEEAARLLSERQDASASKAAEAARLLVERQDESAGKAAEAARLLLAANERVAAQTAAATKATQGQLQQIHTLVNSNLTEAQQRQLDAMKIMIVTMKEVVRLNARDGEPSQEAVLEIERAQGRADALQHDIKRREEQTKVGELQVQIFEQKEEEQTKFAEHQVNPQAGIETEPTAPDVAGEKA